MQEVVRRLHIFLILFLFITAIGTAGFMLLENLSLFDAFYYNIVTMSTVGYGDIHPTKQTSRILAIMLIVMGGATFLGVIANATELLILKRESKNRTRKINMVLGVFFSEVGYKLLDFFALQNNINSKIRNYLLIDSNWTDNQFTAAIEQIKEYKFEIASNDLDLQNLKDFLHSKRYFLLTMLENPVLIEHEDFSESLLSTFHLLDELSNREELISLPKSDKNHITGDINRVYNKLILQWIIYLQHLKKEYPYLFSLALRMNPFDKKASPIISY